MGGYSCGGNPHPMVTSFRRSARYQKCGPYMAGFPGPLAASSAGYYSSCNSFIVSAGPACFDAPAKIEDLRFQERDGPNRKLVVGKAMVVGHTIAVVKPGIAGGTLFSFPVLLGGSGWYVDLPGPSPIVKEFLQKVVSLYLLQELLQAGLSSGPNVYGLFAGRKGERSVRTLDMMWGFIGFRYPHRFSPFSFVESFDRHGESRGAVIGYDSYHLDVSRISAI